MANARPEMQILRRSAGRSVVAAAAYRSGERLNDERTGEVHDYERRGGVMHSQIVAPADAPESIREWATDRAQLWNHVEAIEKHPAAQLARELLVAIPHELPEDDRRGCVLDYAQHIADTYGFVVDASIHAPGREGDERNHHAHLLFSNRPLDEESATGFGNKDRRFDNIAMQRSGQDNEVENLRQQWQEICNGALRRADVRDERGELVQVDLRSYERQGIERETGEHEGPEATQIRRQGGQTEIGQANDEKRERNAERDQLEQQIEASREAIGDELQALHRTPAEDEIKYRFHENDEVQGIFAEQEAARREFVYMGGGSIAPHLFRAGHSRQLAAFNAELDEEAGDCDGTGEGGQRALHREAQRRVDREEAERSWQSYAADRELFSQGDGQGERPAEGWGDFLQELADASRQRQEQKQRGSDRQFPTESDLLDTDPRPGDFAPPLTPDPEPERQGFGHRW